MPEERKPESKPERKPGEGNPGEGNPESESEKGYAGADTDPTPNDHYTVAGVAAGKPTPETPT